MRVLCAYNVNMGALHRVTGEEISGLASRLPPSRSPPKVIASPRDFLAALLSHIKDGSGGELLVMDSETAKFTSRSFSWERRLGGNAGNMANVLASEGGVPR